MAEALDAVMVQIGQWLTIGSIAMAMGMDALSLGIGVGMSGIRRRQMVYLSLLVGMFHVLSPTLGILVGGWLSHRMGYMAVLLGGLLLFLLGVQMIVSGLRGSSLEMRSGLDGSLWWLILLAFGVSVDSLAIGFSMGLFSVDIILSLLVFGFCGFWMSLAGLVLGRRVGQQLGMVGEILGGLILVVFGVSFLL
jgi:putative Mn2+ efflux pump MntP